MIKTIIKGISKTSPRNYQKNCRSVQQVPKEFEKKYMKSFKVNCQKNHQKTIEGFLIRIAQENPSEIAKRFSYKWDK